MAKPWWETSALKNTSPLDRPSRSMARAGAHLSHLHDVGRDRYPNEKKSWKKAFSKAGRVLKKALIGEQDDVWPTTGGASGSPERDDWASTFGKAAVVSRMPSGSPIFDYEREDWDRAASGSDFHDYRDYDEGPYPDESPYHPDDMWEDWEAEKAYFQREAEREADVSHERVGIEDQWTCKYCGADWASGQTCQCEEIPFLTKSNPMYAKANSGKRQTSKYKKKQASLQRLRGGSGKRAKKRARARLRNMLGLSSSDRLVSVFRQSLDEYKSAKKNAGRPLRAARKSRMFEKKGVELQRLAKKGNVAAQRELARRARKKGHPLVVANPASTWESRAAGEGFAEWELDLIRAALSEGATYPPGAKRQKWIALKKALAAGRFEQAKRLAAALRPAGWA